jgi:hypothetical protein
MPDQAQRTIAIGEEKSFFVAVFAVAHPLNRLSERDQASNFE